ncbi:MAG TPA: hypothetical protein VJZ26_11850 [Blastocatellia bacterium]|nr:hypothetical protein [Blastocatellia bacterium]
MKPRILTAVLLAGATALLVTPQSFNVTAQDKKHDQGDWAERDEFRQSYKLAPGATVEVRNMNGPLDIETTTGNTAEVYVVRTARTKADLEYRKVIVEQTATSLRVYTEEPPEEVRNNSNVRHRAVLKLPRPADLTVKNINGHARVGDVDGPAHLANINGKLEVGHAAGFAELSNINGSVTMTMERLGERGIRMRNVNGSINFQFVDGVNADLDITMFNGTVNSTASNLSVQKVDRSSFRGQIGSGGSPITGSHINGAITIRGAN